MNRINELKKERKVKIKWLADYIGVAYSTLNYRLLGKRNPATNLTIS